MAQQLNTQDVNNIFQSIITEFKVLFDDRMKPIVDQIQFHSENYQIISSILKQMPEFKSIVRENEELKKGLNIANGKIVYKGVSDAWDLPFDEVETVLNELVH